VAAALGMESTPLNLGLLERALLEDPNSFEFFTAVRQLERIRPGRSTVGGHADPADEVVRFCVNNALAFPASEIQALTESEGQPARMLVNFMGLTGPMGVLPYVYTQITHERALAKDTALAAFLDLFHHRLISLFFVAWEKHRFNRRYERDGSDPLTEHLLDLGGLGLEHDQRLADVKAQSLAGYAGLLGPEPRGAVALEQLLSDYFGVPVSVEQFLGGWYGVHAQDQCALDEETISSQLGFGSLVGDEVWDPQARVRVRIGPLSREQLEAFLPTGHAHRDLCQLVRLFAHEQFEFEAQLVLQKDDVPGVELGDPDDSGERLGWSTWIRTAPRQQHADQTILRLQELQESTMATR
jgi:type VI secretion system protein ImpH